MLRERFWFMKSHLSVWMFFFILPIVIIGLKSTRFKNKSIPIGPWSRNVSKTSLSATWGPKFLRSTSYIPWWSAGVLVPMSHPFPQPGLSCGNLHSSSLWTTHYSIGVIVYFTILQSTNMFTNNITKWVEYYFLPILKYFHKKKKEKSRY
jgi:hypothetical protein